MTSVRNFSEATGAPPSARARVKLILPGCSPLTSRRHACAAQGWYWACEQQAELLRELPGSFVPIERDLGLAIAAVGANEITFRDACVMDWTLDEATMELIATLQAISLGHQKPGRG